MRLPVQPAHLPTGAECDRMRRLEAVYDAAQELLEVARLRGDDTLPCPSADPKLWTARMQDAWDELRDAREAVEAKGIEPEMSEQTITHECGAKTSSVPRYDLIPTRALDALAARFEHGLERYEKNNWRKGLTDKDYVIGRLNHVIQHAKAAIDKIEGTLPVNEDDDAGAIMWGGAFLCEALEELRNKEWLKQVEVKFGCTTS